TWLVPVVLSVMLLPKQPSGPRGRIVRLSLSAFSTSPDAVPSPGGWARTAVIRKRHPSTAAHNVLRLMSNSPMSTPRNLPSPAGGRQRIIYECDPGARKRSPSANTFPPCEQVRLVQPFRIPSGGFLPLANTIGISLAPIAAVVFGRLAKEGWPH